MCVLGRFLGGIMQKELVVFVERWTIFDEKNADDDCGEYDTAYDNHYWKHVLDTSCG